MKNVYVTDNNGTSYERVTLTTARNLFNSGVTLRVTVRNYNPVNPWGFYSDINISDIPGTFDEVCNTLSYYNKCKPLDFYKVQ